MMDESLPKLIDEVDSLLTDTDHAVDEQHARKLSLMLQRHTALAIQDIYNRIVLFERTQAELQVNLEKRRAVIDERVATVEREVKSLQNTALDYETFKERIVKEVAQAQSLLKDLETKSVGVWVRAHPKTAAAFVVAFVVLITAAPEFWRVLAALAGFPIQLLP